MPQVSTTVVTPTTSLKNSTVSATALFLNQQQNPANSILLAQQQQLSSLLAAVNNSSNLSHLNGSGSGNSANNLIISPETGIIDKNIVKQKLFIYLSFRRL